MPIRTPKEAKKESSMKKETIQFEKSEEPKIKDSEVQISDVVSQSEDISDHYSEQSHTKTVNSVVVSPEIEKLDREYQRNKMNFDFE